MGKVWPAVDVSIAGAGDPDLILAAADDYSPTAVEERHGALRIFFATTERRDRAAQALGGVSVDVDDQDWAAPRTVAHGPVATARGDWSEVALTLLNIGILSFRRGDYGQALQALAASVGRAGKRDQLDQLLGGIG